jgi:fructokinase
MENKILCIGEILIDGITTKSTNTLSTANQLDIMVAGSATNFCRFLHQLNINTTLVGTVGKDSWGTMAINYLKSLGLKVDEINIDSKENTSFIAVSQSATTPDFIAYRGADFMINTINKSLLSESSIVHTTAFCLSKNPAQLNVLNALENAYYANKKISIDWNFSEKIWNDLNNAKQVFNQIQQYSPLFKFSIDDISRFLGKNIEIEEAKLFLDGVNATLICLTCGSKGVYYKTENKNWKHAKVPSIVVANATAAGDSFWAGCISAYNNECSIDDCITKGIEIASLKLQGLFAV